MVPKFRAFSIEAKTMHNILAIDFSRNMYCLQIGKATIGEWFWFREIELMQSTGLKDKNGVEIFEGDIVRYTWDMPSDVNATEKGKKIRISKVFWSDWRASWAVGKKSCNNDLFRYARNGNTVEVIGNVWENPELLEQANES